MNGTQSSNPDLDYADTLWRSADKLRGSIDTTEYKHVVLGLLFLKYISDSLEARKEELKAELETLYVLHAQLMIEPRKLARMCDYLLPRLLRGKVRGSHHTAYTDGRGV